MEERYYYDIEDIDEFKVEINELIDPDFIHEEREQRKLHLHHSNRQRLPRTAPKAKSWSWNRIRSHPNTRHGYH